MMKIAGQKAKEKKILEARGLTFEAGRKILDGIDWAVLEGERWVLLGANGAGKTFVHRETLSFPVRRCTQFFQLVDDLSAVLFFPCPCMF